MIKYILVMIIIVNGKPEAEEIKSFEQAKDCYDARIEVYKQLGTPPKNYGAICLMREVI